VDIPAPRQLSACSRSRGLDLDELVWSVALEAGEVDEFFGACDDCASFWGAGDGDAATAAELEQSFVAQHAKGAEDSVGVDLEDGGEVFGWGEALSGVGLAVCDRAANLAGDLLVEVGGVGFVDLDISKVLVSSSLAVWQA
jgi:hypothetical protein